jgi:hypothetical protein
VILIQKKEEISGSALRNAEVTYFLRPETVTFNWYHNGHKNVHNKISHFYENERVLEHI